ncbi:MAG: hypothetical protein H0W23_01650, partial [Chloroflexia bacterium]|nr:hypothetical protein [Chloroflexia bacterium]
MCCTRMIHLTLVVLVLLSLLGTTAGITIAQRSTPASPAGCLVAVEPNDLPSDAVELPPGASCASAGNAASGQDLYRWTVSEEEAARRWTISVTAIAGQVAALEVYNVEIDAAGTILAATKLVSTTGGVDQPVSHQNLLWAPGTYYIGVASSGPGPYQLAITMGDPLPDTVEPAAEVPGAFAVAGAGDPATVITWILDEADAGSHWTLQLQGSVAAGLRLEMANTAGETLLAVQVGPNGIANIPDLGLPAGAYTISVRSDAG